VSGSDAGTIALMGRVTLPTTRFTVDELFRLVEADALGTTRVELLNGRIHFAGPQSVAHMAAISKGSAAMLRVERPDDWSVVMGTLVLDRYNAPDPDLMLLPVSIGTPSDRWPRPVVVIEVADKTYRKDAGIKLRTYARHGIPDYWIENLREKRIEVYRDPRNPTGKPRDCHYASVQHFTRGQTIELLQRPGVTLAVDELLP
jgi:Uma2 family endonuclease